MGGTVARSEGTMPRGSQISICRRSAAPARSEVERSGRPVLKNDRVSYTVERQEDNGNAPLIHSPSIYKYSEPFKLVESEWVETKVERISVPSFSFFPFTTNTREDF